MHSWYLLCSNIFYFHPCLEKLSNLTCAYSSDGLKPPTSIVFLHFGIPPRMQLWCVGIHESRFPLGFLNLPKNMILVVTGILKGVWYPRVYLQNPRKWERRHCSPPPFLSFFHGWVIYEHHCAVFSIFVNEHLHLDPTWVSFLAVFFANLVVT